MTLDEAIAHAREVAENNRRAMSFESEDNIDDDIKVNYLNCATQHEQLAEWLEELKMYKSLAPRELVSEKQKNDRVIEYDKGFNYGFNTGYNKAIDDFSKDVKDLIVDLSVIRFKHIDNLAEQLKEGILNDWQRNTKTSQEKAIIHF